jgi:serine/threonine protein kinase
MAPEVLANQRYSNKADIYSFGMVMWECCARQVPFEGLNGVQAGEDSRHAVESKFDSRHARGACITCEAYAQQAGCVWWQLLRVGLGRVEPQLASVAVGSTVRCWCCCRSWPTTSVCCRCCCVLPVALAVMSRGMRPEIPQHTPAGLAALMQVRGLDRQPAGGTSCQKVDTC